MNEKALRVLEFDVIRERLASHCVSGFGEELARELLPSLHRIEVKVWQQETAEAVSFIMSTGLSPVKSFDDVRQPLERARIGAVLNMGQLLAIARMMATSRALHQALMASAPEHGRLYGYAVGLVSYRELEEEIRRCILSEEEMADQASHDLYRIRREIRQCHSRIRERMNQLIRSATYQRYLQESIITIRNGRYVVPVRQEFRGQVPGLIHDQSGSGQTLFVEPMAVVEINNELKELQAQEQEEIQRILAELSSRVGHYEEDLSRSLQLMAQLDFVFAKAKLALDMEATEPKINDQGQVRIMRGRHPMIDPKVVVPSTLYLGEDFTTLVITGPNTGGKTVTLKVCGLFALMTQAGLHVPADDGTTFPIFDNVFADIGDEQSIEQSLSTFSGHMTHIVRILEEVTPQSLVLLDELGAGTDPTEGAALAIAILERLMQRQVRTMATTHYSELKGFALSTPGVENASVEFDVQSLRPTYRLSIGIPGKSNAFEISARLGLDASIIDQAKEHLTAEQLRFEDVIQDAEFHKQLAEKERQVAEEARRETEAIRRQAEREQKKLEEQRAKILREAQEEALKTIHGARNQANQIIADLKRVRKMEGMSDRDRAIMQARDALRAGEAAYAAPEKQAEQMAGEPVNEVTEGMMVMVAHLGQVGKVQSVSKKGEITVQVGAMQVKVKKKDLRTTQVTQSKPAIRKERTSQLRMNSVPIQLDIRGMMAEEGIIAVDKYLDNAVLNGLNEVSIIHGKGTGVLRAAIVAHLRHHPHVDSYRAGKFGEGDAGVTVVTLR